MAHAIMARAAGDDPPSRERVAELVVRLEHRQPHPRGRAVVLLVRQGVLAERLCGGAAPQRVEAAAVLVPRVREEADRRRQAEAGPVQVEVRQVEVGVPVLDLWLSGLGFGVGRRRGLGRCRRRQGEEDEQHHHEELGAEGRSVDVRRVRAPVVAVDL